MKWIRLLSIFAWKFAKNMFCWRKIQKNTKYIETEGFDEKKIKIAKENTDVNKSSNQRKCTKSDQRNWKQLKNFNKYRKKLWETRAIAAIKNNPKYFYIFIKNNSKIRAGIGPVQDEEGNLEPINQKMCKIVNEQYNSVFSTPDPTMT